MGRALSTEVMLEIQRIEIEELLHYRLLAPGHLRKRAEENGLGLVQE